MPSCPHDARDHADLTISTYSTWGELCESDRRAVLAIYADSFPAEERADLTRANRDNTAIWLVQGPGREVVGFATTVFLVNANVALLEYIAVTAARRGSGVGAYLFDAIVRRLADENRYSGLLVEIEDPRHVTADNRMARRRERFYERLGAYRLECIRQYRIPSFTDPSQRVMMTLLWRSIHQAEPPRGGPLKEVLTSLYHEYYANVADRFYLSELLAEVVC